MTDILLWVKAPYAEEIRALPDVYATMLAADLGPLCDSLAELGRGPAVFIGSGGTMVAAHLASRLQERVARQPARPCTALEALELPQLTHRGALLFTSSAKHPDARRVLEDFRRARFRPSVVLTHRAVEDVAELAGPDAQVVRLPSLVQPDGFLATGSILQIVVALLRGYLASPQLNPEFSTEEETEPVLRDEVLVLTPPALFPVAADLEVRLVESGLAAVSISDYRNFAHGRHTGFARRLDRITVIALSGAQSRPLAESTLDALPAAADVRRWHDDGPWSQALVNLLVKAMEVAGAQGASAGVDIARPGVPAFGRRIYRLALGRRIPPRRTGSVERKLLALGVGDSEPMRALYAQAAAQWHTRLREERFGAVVLDYDGTVCWTGRRRSLPDEQVREPLQRLLGSGMVVGFASGRGQSLYKDLRRWLPKLVWPRVLIGLYNGAVRLRLDETLPDLRSPTDWSSAVVAALADLPLRDLLAVEERATQVTLELARAGTLHHGRLDELVRDRLATVGVEAQVLASGHSLDVILPETSKARVHGAAVELCGGSAISIGDQGQIGGNDHALLASTPFSLTVDRCSADPSRCWYAGTGEHAGPALLARYLRAMRKLKAGVAIGPLEGM